MTDKYAIDLSAGDDLQDEEMAGNRSKVGFWVIREQQQSSGRAARVMEQRIN